jgi:hypothetical protein
MFIGANQQIKPTHSTLKLVLVLVILIIILNNKQFAACVEGIFCIQWVKLTAEERQ